MKQKRDISNPRYCPIWSVWNDTEGDWATNAGFSTQIEAQELANKCRVASRSGIRQKQAILAHVYSVRVREEYSLMTLTPERVT